MASTLDITITSIPSIDDQLDLSLSYTAGADIETFKNLRQQSYQVTIGSTIQDCVINLKNAIELDFPLQIWNFSIIEQTEPGDTLRIEAPFQDNVFDNATASDSMRVVVSTTPSDPAIEITSIEFSQAQSNPCENIEVAVTTNVNMDSININGNLITGINTDQYVFTHPRNLQDENITVFAANNNTQATQSNIFVPPTLSINIFESQTPNGITLQVIVAPLILEYRLISNGVVGDWQDSNVFTGLIDGVYTVEVRDQYGCQKSTNITVDNVFDVTAPPFISVPLLNPLYFAENNDETSNNENTLNSNYTVQNNYLCYHQPVKVGDLLQIQYKSSYQHNKAFLVDENDNITTIQPTQITNNIGYEDIRDGLTFSYEGNLAVSYQGGDIYDDAGDVIGQSSLFGQLLFDQVAGELVNVEGYGWLQIESIVINNDYGTFMVFNQNFTGVDETKKIKFTYNVEDYELFEFSIDTTTLSGLHQIYISADNNQFSELEQVKYISEPFNVFDLDETKYHRIRYWNTENNQIAWETGIMGIVRFPKLNEPIYSSKEENEIFMTDTKTSLLEAQNDEQYQFSFKPLPLNNVRHLDLITSNDQLEIDGLAYVKEDEIDKEALIGSNLYQVTMTLIKTKGFNSNSRVGINETDLDNGLLQESENGFVKL